MSRLPRLAIGGHVHLVLQRALQPLFKDDDDRELLLRQLAAAARTENVAIHAYALLDQEILLLVTPPEAVALSRLMQGLGRSYVAGFNRRHGRSGTLWQGRFRATVVDADAFLIPCMCYVESRSAALGYPPMEYRWSSAWHHLGQTRSAFIVEHPSFWRLGNTPFDREATYRSVLERGLPPSEARAIEAAAQKGWALGGEAFLLNLEGQTERPIRPRARGRPRNTERRTEN
ncbi:transposase [Piscinibacter sp.]|uniref:transposase n=1 Tax=Piscinibacter sp. TaxID=1903157 RepID=UPI002C7D1C77|nr:transposase [Albitalea sp.]HUG23252.1 transposase [Albitalea sp.]